MAIGNHALHPVLSFRAEAWPHHDLSTDEVLLDQVPELAPEAVDVRKLYQVFSSNDVGAGERMLRCAAKHEALSKEGTRSEEHTSELQSLMRISYAVFCLKKKNRNKNA